MGTTEFPAPGPGAGINSQIEINRTQPVVLRNSRFLVGVTMTGSLFAAVFGYMCPRLWSLARNTAGYQVRLDSRGVNSNLGTKKKPSDLFLTWD
jgi:hypothetical protein